MTKFTMFKNHTLAAALVASLSAGTALAGEAFVLDTHELDLVTAGDLITGFVVDANSTTTGFNVSNPNAFATSNSNTSELISVATGVAGGTAFALGADDGTPPAANVETSIDPLPGTENTVLFARTISIGRSNPAFAFAAEYTFGVAIDSSVIPRFNN